MYLESCPIEKRSQVEISRETAINKLDSPVQKPANHSDEKLSIFERAKDLPAALLNSVLDTGCVKGKASFKFSGKPQLSAPL